MAIEFRILQSGETRLLESASGLTDHPVDPASAREFLADPRHHIAVAIEDGTIVAFASGVDYFHPDKPAPELFVNEIGVVPQRRGDGIGRAVLETLLAHGRARGCREAWVLTDAGKETAARLFARCGGEESDRPPRMFSFRLAETAEEGAAATSKQPPRDAGTGHRPSPGKIAKVTIRAVEPSDAESWLRMRSRLFDDGSPEEHRREIAEYFAGRSSEPAAVLIAEDESSIAVGFIELSLRACAEGCRTSPVAYVEGWYVEPEARGKGVGRRLIAASEEWGRRQGCSELASDTRVDDEESTAAHEAVGFEDAGIVRCFRKTLS